MHLGLPARILGWMITGLIVKWLIPYVPQICVIAAHCLDLFTRFVFGFSMLGIIWTLLHIAFIVILYAGLISLFFPKFRQKLPALSRFAFKTLRSLSISLLFLMKVTFRLLYLFTNGIQYENSSKKPRSPHH